MAGAHQRRIPQGASLTLSLVPGVHALTGQIVIDHPDGNRLSIVGAPTSPGTVLLTSTWPGTAIYVAPGAALGLLDGVTLTNLSGSAGATGLATRSGYLRVGAGVIIEGFPVGISSNLLGVVVSDVALPSQSIEVTGASRLGAEGINGGIAYLPGLQVSNVPAGARGVFASRSGTVVAADAYIEGSASTPGTYAAWAELQSNLYLPRFAASGFTTGALATGGSSITMDEADLSVATHGARAATGSVVRVVNGLITTTGPVALRADSGGFVYALATSGTVEADIDASASITGGIVVH